MLKEHRRLKFFVCKLEIIWPVKVFSFCSTFELQWKFWMGSPGCWTVAGCQGLGFYAAVTDWNSRPLLNLLQEPGRFTFSYVLCCLSVQGRIMEDALTVGYRGWMMLEFGDVVSTPACTARAVCPQASPLRGSALLMKVITGDGSFVRWCVAAGFFAAWSLKGVPLKSGLGLFLCSPLPTWGRYFLFLLAGILNLWVTSSRLGEEGQVSLGPCSLTV